MSKATTPNTTGAEDSRVTSFTSSQSGIDQAVARLRAIAAASGDALIAEGPVNPDHRLLGMCGEIAHRRKLLVEAKERWGTGFVPLFQRRTSAEHERQAELEAARRKASHDLRHLLREVAKLPATTGPGIYAKAVAVRSASTCATVLAMSLADDLIASETLRLTLWAEASGA